MAPVSTKRGLALATNNVQRVNKTAGKAKAQRKIQIYKVKNTFHFLANFSLILNGTPRCSKTGGYSANLLKGRPLKFVSN